MACDVCGMVGNTSQLNEHMDCPQIEQICDNCRRVADKMLDKFRHKAWRRTRKKLLFMQKKHKQMGANVNLQTASFLIVLTFCCAVGATTATFLIMKWIFL